MPFIPHTEDEVREMLAAIGAPDIEALFDEIPHTLRGADLSAIPAGLGEQAVSRLMRTRAAADRQPLCFLGAGAYEHHIPAAVWEITTRGEYYTAYTPYQAEASQGTLQLLYEYQTMMARLMAMEVSNASLYDGASALAEAVLMAVRANRAAKSRRILMPASVHPRYRQVVQTIVRHQGIELVSLDFDAGQGRLDPDSLPGDPGPCAALVIPQPNFFGCLEQVDALTDWAHRHKMLVIAVVNPLAMALLKPPGQWGARGADIACGEGQPLGVPLASGGPYFGFMCCRRAHMRQMPGRIVGRTIDLDGRTGYSLTLQAREQHIRRSKATSNICTNQGLMVTAATIYMALLGGEGLRRTAAACHDGMGALLHRLADVPGVAQHFTAPAFHETVLRIEGRPVEKVLAAMAEDGLLGGLALAPHYPALADTLLVCVTEARSGEDLDAYVDALRRALAV